jgi:thioredoxin 1
MKQYQNKIEVVEISTDDLPEVASDAGVLSIPTIQLYYKGKVMDTIVGCVAKNVLARSVDKVLEDLGMLEDKV